MKAVAIPAGMVPWHGGDSAPVDWNGGPVRSRRGRMFEPHPCDWQNHRDTGLTDDGVLWDIIAYTPTKHGGRPAEFVTGEPFLDQLRRVNADRYHAWFGDGQDAGILFDAAELGGEVGELLNVVKKLVREEAGWRGSRATPEDFADECADVLICLDKLARRRGVDLTAATVAKFNGTSEKQGFPHRLTAAPVQPSSGMAEAVGREKLAFTFAFARGYQIAEETSQSCAFAMDQAWADFAALTPATDTNAGGKGL